MPGGNRKHLVKHWEHHELAALVDAYLKNEACCPVTQKKHKTFYDILYGLGFYLDNESRKQFSHMVNVAKGVVPVCGNADCGALLTIDRLRASARVYNKFCTQCSASYVWARKSDANAEARKIRGEKVTKSKLLFYQTDKGKEVAARIGAKNSIKMKQYNNTEEGKAQNRKKALNSSVVMKAKILAGEFTPCTHNSRTHWQATITRNGTKQVFRSSWEACVAVSNPTWEHETVRIPYFDGTRHRIYIVDFVDHATKMLYEIKPEAHVSRAVYKIEAAHEWCKNNGFTFVLITERNINEFIDESKFDSKTLVDILVKMKKGAYGKNRD
jgi:hypothetical protein